MTKRNLVLIGSLALAYIIMAAYLTYRYPEQGNILGQIAFGALLVGSATIGARLSDRGARSKGIIRALKILFASWAFSFAAWMGISVLLLPFIGFEGFELIQNQWFIFVLLGGALVASPLVASKLT